MRNEMETGTIVAYRDFTTATIRLTKVPLRVGTGSLLQLNPKY